LKTAITGRNECASTESVTSNIIFR
jgi:hypothetical protein